MILESKVVQKMKLEKNSFYKKWSPKLMFLNDFFWKKIPLIFGRRNLTLKLRFRHFLTNRNYRIVLKQFPLSRGEYSVRVPAAWCCLSFAIFMMVLDQF